MSSLTRSELLAAAKCAMRFPPGQATCWVVDDDDGWSFEQISDRVSNDERTLRRC